MREDHVGVGDNLGARPGQCRRDVVDAQIEQRGRRAAVQQQAHPVEVEEQESGRVELSRGGRAEQLRVELRRTIEIFGVLSNLDQLHPASVPSRLRQDGVMEHRTLGKSGIEVSIVGFGAWGIGGGWGETADTESVAALNLAIDRGVTFIDTAYGYGGGHSERLIGDVLRSRPETIVVATKVPPVNMRWPARDGHPGGRGLHRQARARVHRGEPAPARPRLRRRAAVPRLGPQLARPGRLAG